MQNTFDKNQLITSRVFFCLHYANINTNLVEKEKKKIKTLNSKRVKFIQLFLFFLCNVITKFNRADMFIHCLDSL